MNRLTRGGHRAQAGNAATLAAVLEAPVGLPRIDTPEGATRWGYAHGSEGLDLWIPPTMALDLANHARDGHALGMSDAGWAS